MFWNSRTLIHQHCIAITKDQHSFRVFLNDKISGDQQGKEAPKVIPIFRSGPKLGTLRQTGRSATAATTIRLLFCLYITIPLLPSTSSSRATSAIKSSWRSSYVPRSSVRPSRSPAGTSAALPHNPLGSFNVDAGTGTRTYNRWEWEPLGLSGILHSSRARRLWF